LFCFDGRNVRPRKRWAMKWGHRIELIRARSTAQVVRAETGAGKRARVTRTARCSGQRRPGLLRVPRFACCHRRHRYVRCAIRCGARFRLLVGPACGASCHVPRSQVGGASFIKRDGIVEKHWLGLFYRRVWLSSSKRESAPRLDQHAQFGVRCGDVLVQAWKLIRLLS
jgi:hypothetical protein